MSIIHPPTALVSPVQLQILHGLRHDTFVELPAEANLTLDWALAASDLSVEPAWLKSVRPAYMHHPLKSMYPFEELVEIEDFVQLLSYLADRPADADAGGHAYFSRERFDIANAIASLVAVDPCPLVSFIEAGLVQPTRCDFKLWFAGEHY